MENKRLIDEIIEETQSILKVLKQCDEHEQPTTKHYYIDVLKLCELIKKKENKMKKQKYNKISLNGAEKYSNLIDKVVKDELVLQLFNGIEASIEQAQFCLEQKKIDWASDFLKQAKKEVNKLWEMIKKGK